MRELYARVTADGSHGPFHVHTNMGEADPCVVEPVLIAIAKHCGYETGALRKALAVGNPGDPDPRFPELTTLIRQARANWAAWGDNLTAMILQLSVEGHLFPLTPTSERALQELFNDHQVTLLVNFSGRVPDGQTDRFDDLVDRGILQRGAQDRSLIDSAFRHGRRMDALTPASITRADAPPFDEVVRQAMRVQLTEQDESALEYARTRAGTYMRRPAIYALNEAQRVLTEGEIDPIRAAVAEAIEERRTPERLARDLRDAVQGNPTLTNDMDRVARTELAFAHSYGAYVALKDQSKRAGIDDPEVYKFASPNGCVDCRRIWGPMGNPRRYKLSFVEARESGGANFRRPRAEWGPVIGPVHPHCTEGPLQFYHPDIIDAINDASDELAELFD